MREHNHGTHPVTGLLIAEDPIEALQIRTAALAREVLLTCPPTPPDASRFDVAIVATSDSPGAGDF